MNVVSITKSSKLLLTSCVPAVKAKLATICGEVQRVHLDSNCCCTNRATSAKMLRRQGVFQYVHPRLEKLLEDGMLALTFILLLELSCQVPLHKSGFPYKKKQREI